MMAMSTMMAYVAETKAETDVESVTSSARWKTTRPVVFWMCAAVTASVLAVRAQIATWVPSRASSSATARPSPLLAAATIATRPVSPSSTPAPHSKLQSSRETRSASIVVYSCVLAPRFRHPCPLAQAFDWKSLCAKQSAALRCSQLPAYGGTYATDQVVEWRAISAGMFGISRIWAAIGKFVPIQAGSEVDHALTEIN